MAIQLEAATKRWRGLSTDEKPQPYREDRDSGLLSPPVGSVFVETDTGRRFVWAGQWERQEQTIEAILEDLISVNHQVLGELCRIRRGHAEHLWEEEAPETD